VKSCTLVTVLVFSLTACSSPPPSGGGGTGTQAFAPPAPTPTVDSKILGVWDFTGQIRGGTNVLCGVDVNCYAETLQFTADSKLIMMSEEYGTLNCTFSTANQAVTYKCGNNAPVTNDYTLTGGGIMLCVWQNDGLAYCYTHR